MRLLPAFLFAYVLLACGSSSPQDICQQTVSLLVAQQAKDESCVPDAGPAGDGGGPAFVDLDAGLQYCEANLKSCRPEDIAAWQKSIDCEKALLPDIQCQWYTEANPFADSSYYAYKSQTANCSREFMPPSPACSNAYP